MGIFNKLKQGVSDAGNKAKTTVEATRLKGQIANNTGEINDLFLKIGREVFASYNTQTNTQVDENVKAHIININNLLGKNKEIEKNLHKVRNQKDCVCGHTVTLDSEFCSACGHKIAVSAIVVQTQFEAVEKVENVPKEDL
ncbi:hypothetical protein CSE16_17365 [Solibacillus sp. R5-41]|uniref:hypothetical protein n=1 Tax=Solibacillus sp. R5-41 TaxID=2048654 RepID=UPI000C1282D9|nr:hypothetical protein [Solibacillus sp. R5-41]ATP41659.1 hypothetical protein CSE16_17365 [Solibacillus sp. R5-41]